MKRLSSGMSLVSHMSVKQIISKFFSNAKQLAKTERLFKPSKLLTLNVGTFICEFNHTFELI